MIIKKIILASYGKFTDFEFYPKNGINIIYGRNGSGKSTLASAIKTILYPNAKKEYSYKRLFIPHGEKKGFLRMEFENDGVLYESELTLGKTNSSTAGRTTEKSLNRTVCEGSPGEFFLGIKEEVFDLLCGIMNLSALSVISFKDNEIYDILSEKQNLLQADITPVLDRLDADINSYKRKTASGLIYPLRERLARINGEIENQKRIAAEEKVLLKEEETVAVPKKNIFALPAAAAVLGIIALLFNKYITAAALAVGIVSAAACYLSFLKKKTQAEIKKQKIKAKRENLFNNLTPMSKLTEEKIRLEKEISEKERKLSVLIKTKETITAAAETFKSSYIPALNAELLTILKQIINIDKITLDDKLNIVYNDRRESVTREYLSSGIRDIADFALHLAVYKLSGIKAPLIMDDCLMEADDENFAKCMNYLAKHHNGQIFYFTCHKRVFGLEDVRITALEGKD